MNSRISRKTNEKYVFDVKIAEIVYGIIFSLETFEERSCFLLGDSQAEVDEFLKKLPDFPAFKECHYFICPEFTEKLSRTGWKANTVRALKPNLYIGTDPDTVEQTRLLGIPSALYRL